MDILKNKSVKSSNYFSRYNGVNTYYNTHDKKYQLGLKSWLKPNFDYTRYTVQDNDTYDYIALKFYNNPTYYWIICDANKILDPMTNPTPGDVLMIPSLGGTIQFEVY